MLTIILRAGAMAVAALIAAGCSPAPSRCADAEMMSLLKQLAVGKPERVDETTRQRVDAFLDIADVQAGGSFGSRESCSAMIALSPAASAALGDRAGAEIRSPVPVEYDIVLPMDQSTVTVAVVETKKFPFQAEREFADAYAALP